jgi:asparagine synthase (glutamine-hydrolysing)
MCGIAGAFGSSRTRELAEAMATAIAHRGPDGHGFFSHAAGTLAHRRLSIIDLSDAGLQPMASADGRWVVSFNGEIYNYKELREELSGYPFRTQSDTEIILAAWDAWGEAALDRFLGMFAFAILDTRSGDLVVVRDRVGIKPLFYAEHDGRLLFASEIKALLAAGVPSRPNEPMIGDYLVRGLYSHTDETFFEGVCSLPPGHLLRRSAAGAVSVARWWDVAALLGLAGLPEMVGHGVQPLLARVLLVGLSLTLLGRAGRQGAGRGGMVEVLGVLGPEDGARAPLGGVGLKNCRRWPLGAVILVDLRI